MVEFAENPMFVVALEPTQNLMVEVASNIEVLKIWWLKITKTLKTQNLTVEIIENIRTMQNLMMIEVA